MNNKKTTFIAGIIILASLVYLSVREFRLQSYKTGGQTWFLYFNDPRSNDVSFTIENYTPNADFTWSLYLQEDKIQEGTEKINPDKKKAVSPSIVLPDIGGKKITVKVRVENQDEKVIYKYFK
jgi:hypothetical protein